MLRKYIDKLFLKIAKVPKELQPSALSSLSKARKQARFLTFKKFYARLFKAGWISEQLDWSHNRLIEVRPDKLLWDIAPMKNVTSHGDNPPWDENGPVEGCWLNTDPKSEEYKYAVSRNYWCKGTHPRSKKAIKAWYRRNAGEGLAYQRGEVVSLEDMSRTYKGSEGRISVTVSQSKDTWLMQVHIRLLGRIGLKARYGFEIDNVFAGERNVQAWFPIKGYDLKAPVTNPPWLFTFKKQENG